MKVKACPGLQPLLQLHNDLVDLTGIRASDVHAHRDVAGPQDRSLDPEVPFFFEQQGKELEVACFPNGMFKDDSSVGFQWLEVS